MSEPISKSERRPLRTLWKVAVVLIAVLVIGMLAWHGTFLSKKYLEPWDVQYHRKFEDPRLRITAHGLLAPNAHNMQSWRIVLDKNDHRKFRLYLDEKRLLPATDPYHRQSMISQGTFLELCYIAARQLGYEAVIRVFPEGDLGLQPAMEDIRSKPTAEITLIDSTVRDQDLYRSIFQRVTTRTPYLDRPLTGSQIEKLSGSVDYDSVYVVVFQESADLSRLKELAVKGVDVESRLKSTMNESHVVLRFNEYQKNKYRNGLTMSSQGHGAVKQFFIETFASLFPLSLEEEGRIWREAENERIQRTPAYMMIFSDKNDRASQVHVGRLYARIQLAGTAMGLSMQPTMQITQEYPEMAELYRQVTEQFVKQGQTVQMLFRIGQSEKKVEHSPRRDVMELVDSIN